MNLPEWHLLRPAWLLALLPLAFGLWRLARRESGASAWRGVVDTHLLPHLLVGQDGRLRWRPLLLLSLGGVLGIVALAGPVRERLPQPAFQAQAERVIVLDLSPDMNATDLAPSRLAHARYEVLDLLKRFREGQTGLIAYGAEPFVVSPLTADANTIAAQVPSLTTDLLPVEGPKRTGLALEEAGRLLRQAGSTRGRVILLTDALDNPAAALDAARNLRKQGYRLSVLGLGTAAGATVPLPGGGFLKDSGGAILMPKLASSTLQSLASTGGGRYITATLDDTDVEALAGDQTGQWQRKAAAAPARADQWREDGPWLLLALLPLAAAAFRRGWIGPLLLIVLLAPHPPAEAFSWPDLWQRPDQQAARLLDQGAARDAARTFRRPDWRAAAAYTAGDYRKALAALDGMDNAKAWYNRGNTLARLGDYQAAIAQYDKVLAQHPDDADARHNRDLLRQLIEQRQQSRQGSPGNRQDANKQDGNAQQQGQGQKQSGQAGQGQKQSGGQDQTGQSRQGDAHPPSAGGQSGRKPGQDKPGAPSGAGQARTPTRTAQEAAGSQDTGARTAQARPDTGKEDAAARAKSAAAGNEGGSEPPPRATADEPPTAMAGGAAAEPAASGQHAMQGGTEPGIADLLGSQHRREQTQTPGAAVPEALTEAQQALEHQLNRVPDDPAGLLRQRFLLQHLRRSGQL